MMQESISFHPLPKIKAFEQYISGIFHLQVLGLHWLQGAKAAVDSGELLSRQPNATTQQQSDISESWSRSARCGQWCRLSLWYVFPSSGQGIQAGSVTGHSVSVRMWSHQRMSPSWWVSAAGQQSHVNIIDSPIRGWLRSVGAPESRPCSLNSWCEHKEKTWVFGHCMLVSAQYPEWQGLSPAIHNLTLC